MPPLVRIPPIFAELSFERVWEFVVEIAGRFRTDPWGSLYWSAIWICGFVITFLLVRMLFTRWGDRNITFKTLTVSLLMHLLLAMVSNTVVFEPTQAGSNEIIGVPIRRVIIEGSNRSGDVDSPIEDPFERPVSLPSRSPAWEKSPSLESPSLTRTPKRVLTAAEADMPAERRETAVQEVEIPEERPTELPSAEAPAPATQRSAEKIAKANNAAQPRIDEETAQSRNDTNPGAGKNTRSRPASVENEVGVDREMRNRTSAETETTQPSLASSSVDSAIEEKDSPSRPARQTDSPNTARLSTGGGPKAKSSDPNDDLETGDGSPRPTSPQRKFTRTGSSEKLGGDLANTGPSRPLGSSNSEEGGRGDRTGPRDPAESNGVESGDPSAGSRISEGDSTVGMISPNVMRSGSDGAIEKNSGRVPATYRLRTSPQRFKIAIGMGASEETERAVEASLQWLAAHQRPQGNWEPIETVPGREPEKLNFSDGVASAKDQQIERERSGFKADVGLTALSVLAFLGKGYTHEEGPFADNVERALRWIMAQQDPQGFLGGQANRYAKMYCHGMATIALGEAYGMTKDRRLKEPLARAIKYIVAAQYPDGAWRYSDWRQLETKHRRGDMSMFGWQLMALKSARTAGLDVPETAFDHSVDFLIAIGNDSRQRGSSQFGGLVGYRVGEPIKPSMTAESLFCKQMLGIKRSNKAAGEAVEYLSKNLPRQSKQDLYYWYYGTLAMYHHGGESWKNWNQALLDALLPDQRTDGDFAGSWNPRFPWGDYGGRVFSTAVSTLCLEVYYRFLPLYQTDSGDSRDPGK